jgi:hypothetical protein
LKFSKNSVCDFNNSDMLINNLYSVLFEFLSADKKTEVV